MPTSNSQPDDQDSTTERTTTRRSYLSTIAASGLIIVPDTTTTAPFSTDPSEVLITHDQLPAPFTSYSEDIGDSAFDAVQSPTGDSAPRNQVSLNSFCAGDDSEEPLWVAGSSACLPIDREDVATAAEMLSEEYTEFISEYDEETGPTWHFDIQYNESDAFHEWRTEIYIRSHTSGTEGPEIAGEPTLIDTFRLQYVNNILFGTGLFGPTNWAWSYSDLLDRLTEYQHSQAVSVSEAEITAASGGL